MGPILGRTVEHLGTTDLGMIATRRRILRAGRDLAEGLEPAAAADRSVFHVHAATVTLPREASIYEDAAAREAVKART